MTKRAFFQIFLLSVSLLMIRCGKSSTPPPDAPEATLALKIDPTPANGITPSLSASYAFTAVITSTLPKNGVDLEFETTEELSGTSVDKKQSRLTASSMQLNTINLTTGLVYVVKVTVTSVTKPSNKASVSFRVARK